MNSGSTNVGLETRYSSCAHAGPDAQAHTQWSCRGAKARPCARPWTVTGVGVWKGASHPLPPPPTTRVHVPDVGSTRCRLGTREQRPQSSDTKTQTHTKHIHTQTQTHRHKAHSHTHAHTRTQTHKAQQTNQTNKTKQTSTKRQGMQAVPYTLPLFNTTQGLGPSPARAQPWARVSTVIKDQSVTGTANAPWPPRVS